MFYLLFALLGFSIIGVAFWLDRLEATRTANVVYGFGLVTLFTSLGLLALA